MEKEAFKDDHDLLIAVHENLKIAITNINALTSKVEDFNNNYAKKADVDPITKDHESRLRRLEYLGAIAVGVLYVIQFLSKFISPTILTK